MTDDEKGQYYVFAPWLSRNPEKPIPNSHHIFVNDGALMIYDSDDNIIRIFAPNQWREVMNQDQYNEWEKRKANQ